MAAAILRETPDENLNDTAVECRIHQLEGEPKTVENQRRLFALRTRQLTAADFKSWVC